MEKQLLGPCQIRISETMHQRAAKHAQTQGLTFSAYVRQLIAKDLPPIRADK